MPQDRSMYRNTTEKKELSSDLYFGVIKGKKVRPKNLHNRTLTTT